MLKNNRSYSPSTKRGEILLVLICLVGIGSFIILNRYFHNTYELDELNKNILNEDLCQSPSWYDLYPGKSTENDVKEKLSSLAFIESNSIRSVEYPIWPGDQPHQIFFNCKGQGQGKFWCGFVVISDGLLKSVHLEIFGDVYLSQLISKFGPPQYIDYYLAADPMTKIMVNISWPSKNVVTKTVINEMGLKDKLFNSASLPKNLKINWIEYCVPERFDFPSPGLRISWPGME